MSQSQDMAAINDLVFRTTPTNASAAAIQDAWIQWYGGLASFERDYDPDALADAKARRDAFNRAMANGAVSAPGPVAAVAPGPKPTLRKGSKDPKGSTAGPVHEWQAIVGAVPDGDFGSKTDALTKTWQKAHGLVADGVVGPLTWAQAIANSTAAAAVSAPLVQASIQAVQNVLIASAAPTPVQAAVARAAEVVSTAAGVAANTSPAQATAAVQAAATLAAANVSANTPLASASFPILREGSKGDSVKTWQTLIGVSPVDGVFGPNTASRTKSWQASHGLTADGIVGPASWTAAALPSSGMINDPIGASFNQAANAISGALTDLHRLTPTWLKATGAVLAGWSAILLWGSTRKAGSTRGQ